MIYSYLFVLLKYFVPCVLFVSVPTSSSSNKEDYGASECNNILIPNNSVKFNRGEVLLLCTSTFGGDLLILLFTCMPVFIHQ